MKTLKKSVALLLVLVMCLSMVNLSALAADTAHTHDGKCSLCAQGRHEDGLVCDCCGYGDKDKGPSTEEPNPGNETKDCGVGNHKMTLKGNQLVCSVCGATCGQVDENGHHKIDSVTEKATCYKDGYATITCVTCGTVTETIPALTADYTGQKWEPCGDGKHKMTCMNCDGTPDGHSKIEFCVDKDNDGKCDECGAELKKECDHRAGNHEDLSQYKAPTCTEKGQQVYVCDECGGVVDNKEIPALGHDLTHCSGEDATCTEAGTKESWVCNRVVNGELCGAQFADAEGKTPVNSKDDLTIPALGHLYDVKVVENEPTCTEKGNYTIQCSRCGAEVGHEEEPALGHEWGSWTDMGDSLRHFRSCKRDGCDYEETGTHNRWETFTKDPACTEDGYTEKKCLDCGYTETTVIPATGHAWGGWQSDGAKGHYQVCAKCDSHSDTVEHTFGEWHDVEGQTPTCAVEGRQVHECQDCGYKEERGVVTLEPEFGPWTPYNETQHQRVCENCNGDVEKHVEYADHTWGGWYPVDGSETEHVRECSDCGAKQVAGHRFGAWETVTEATIAAEGLEKHTCADCGYEETRPISRLPYTPPTGGDGGTVTTTYYTLTVSYVDENGNTVAPQHSSRHASGYSYSVASPTVEGMAPDQAAVSGRLTRNTEVTVVYTADVVEIDEPDVPMGEEPDDPDAKPEEPTEPEEPEEKPEDPEDPEEDLGDEDVPLSGDPEEPEEDLGDEDVPLGEKPEDPGEEDLDDPEVPLDDSPETGDAGRIALWSGMLAASVTGMLALLATGKKKEDEEA